MTDEVKQKMKDKTVSIHGKDYLTVAGRIELAHDDEENTTLSITTELVPADGRVLFKATVVTHKGTYTGFSAADPSKAIEKQSPYEVAETSAVGRALGFAGYGLLEGIATADEMVKAGATQPVAQQAIQPAEWGASQPSKQADDRPEGDAWFDDADAKVCSAHAEPAVLQKGHSKSKNKDYWYHRNADGQICFGSGYKD